MDEYIKKDDVLKLLNRNSITKAITFADGISIYDSVKNLPTADVAPKSEVALEVIEYLESNGLLNMNPWAIYELKKKYKEGE